MTAKCKWIGTYGDPSAAPQGCSETAVWKDLCPDHGGHFPSPESFMKLLADLTGWGEQHLVVNTKFMYTVYRISNEDERRVPLWSVSTTMCSTKTPVNAHADRYEMALWLLALDVQSQLQHLIEVHNADANTADKKLAQFLDQE